MTQHFTSVPGPPAESLGHRGVSELSIALASPVIRLGMIGTELSPNDLFASSRSAPPTICNETRYTALELLNIRSVFSICHWVGFRGLYDLVIRQSKPGSGQETLRRCNSGSVTRSSDKAHPSPRPGAPFGGSKLIDRDSKVCVGSSSFGEFRQFPF